MFDYVAKIMVLKDIKNNLCFIIMNRTNKVNKRQTLIIYIDFTMFTELVIFQSLYQ